MMGDERDSSSEGDEQAPRRKAPVLNLKRIRRDCQAALDDALGVVDAKGAFTNEAVRAAVHGVIGKLDLNLYAWDIAQRMSTSITRERNSAFGSAMRLWSAGQFDMFTLEMAHRVWLPLSDGKQVSLANATWSHWEHKRQEERADVREKIAAIRRNDSNFAEVEALMKPDPQCTMAMAMQQLGHWPRASKAA
jgi:hypothetical protein